MKNEIDFGKTIDTDDIHMKLDPLKGVVAILQALELTRDMGQHSYDKYAYLALSMVCNAVIKDFEEMAPNIEYMQEKIREKLQ